jgi:hypothetical protein
MPVINWRALSLTLFIILPTNLLWEATLGVPYGWRGFTGRRDNWRAHYGVEPSSD